MKFGRLGYAVIASSQSRVNVVMYQFPWQRCDLHPASSNQLTLLSTPPTQ